MFGLGPLFAERRARRAEAELRTQSAELRLAMVRRQSEIVQAYDAARTTGRMTGWARPQTSATTELQGALPFLRASARELVRNSPHASRAVRVLASHIAGTGVRPRVVMIGDDPDTAAALSRVTRDQWERFVENCDVEGQLDFYGQQRLMMRAVAEGGEALRIWTPVREGARLFWRCRVIEGDWLDHQSNLVRADGSRVVQGVEFDAIGRRVAYHLHTQHPGDRFGVIGLRHHIQRVPAELVDHVFEVLRPGQVRGVSWFAPVATTLRDLDDLAEAEVVRKKLEACISMVVHNAHDDAADGAAMQAVTDDSNSPIRTSSGAALDRMQPGMILQARPGWGVEFNAPESSGGLVEHMQERLHAIAAGAGVTYMQMTGDTSQANYSSMREGRIEFNRLVDVWQSDLMVQQSGRPAWRRVMSAAQVNGELRSAVLPRARFIPPKRPWVDPQKDVTAAIRQIEARLVDPQTVIEESGTTAEEVIAGLKRWQEMQRELDTGDNTI